MISKTKILTGAMAVGAVLVVAAIASKGYRLGRLIAYVDPDYSKIEMIDHVTVGAQLHNKFA